MSPPSHTSSAGFKISQLWPVSGEPIDIDRSRSRPLEKHPVDGLYSAFLPTKSTEVRHSSSGV